MIKQFPGESDIKKDIDKWEFSHKVNDILYYDLKYYTSLV